MRVFIKLEIRVFIEIEIRVFIKTSRSNSSSDRSAPLQGCEYEDRVLDGPASEKKGSKGGPYKGSPEWEQHLGLIPILVVVLLLDRILHL